MNGSNFGTLFRISTFGESHGRALGVIIDGCPAGLELDEAAIRVQMERRRPGQSKLVSPRKEEDAFEILSGVYEGKTTGAPIMALVWNSDVKSKDYSEIKDLFRPGHADFTYFAKYRHRDYRGGGRSSAPRDCRPSPSRRDCPADFISPWNLTSRRSNSGRFGSC
jgi:chorismate synthase